MRLLDCEPWQKFISPAYSRGPPTNYAKGFLQHHIQTRGFLLFRCIGRRHLRPV